MDNIITIENVTKQYRLGAIGGGTLQGDIQSWIAKKRGKENPNSKIGSSAHQKNELFYALNGINIKIKPGERVGIIGHNGAGKSTLLKLLSRVTAPTDGTIYLNGRITSMLEVGTGFHAELTGRENVYLNGAILGLTKKEIDSKMDDIIAFSECGQFIDTPVKRYSSGMYVKLAFSVAAHLDSEIMIMDEVLAVGDMAFQKKCIDKMNEVSKNQGRTILYVSHNMATIRSLCNRCIVMEHGRVIFDGDVEEAIRIYLNKEVDVFSSRYVYTDQSRNQWVDVKNRQIEIKELTVLGKDSALFENEDKLDFEIKFKSDCCADNIFFRVEFSNYEEKVICTSLLEDALTMKKGENIFSFEIDISQLVSGNYRTIICLYSIDEFGTKHEIDSVDPAFNFSVSREMPYRWEPSVWGNIKMDKIIKLEK